MLGRPVTERIISELLKSQPKTPGQYGNFKSFLIGNFGSTLYETYFKPYNEKIWNADLATIPLDWLEGKLPMPNLQEIVLSNIRRQEEGKMVHSSFFYPKNGGSQFVIDRLAKGIDVALSTPIESLEYSKNGWTVNQKSTFDAIVYSGDVRHLGQLFVGDSNKINLPEGYNNLQANGTHNVLCYTDNTDLSWLYLPEKSVKAHRIIYTGNFSPANNASENRLSCVVEFSGKHSESEMLSEIRKLPGKLKPIRFNYQPDSYVIQDDRTRRIITTIKQLLKPKKFYLCGRFSEWEYYNMDKAIEAAMSLVEEIE